MAKIRSEIDLFDGRPPWGDGKWQGHAYKVVLRFQGRQMTVPFYTGIAHPWPTTRVVVECLASDFFCFDLDYVRNFEDFCSDMGYDTDSRKAEAIYKGGVRQTEAFRRLLGPELLGRLTDLGGDTDLFAKRYSAEEE